MTLEERLAAVEARNGLVEANKRWETSVQRRAAIALLTYVFALLWLVTIEAPAPLLSATVPVLGYLVSTLSLRWLRERFERK